VSSPLFPYNVIFRPCLTLRVPLPRRIAGFRATGAPVRHLCLGGAGIHLAVVLWGAYVRATVRRRVRQSLAAVRRPGYTADSGGATIIEFTHRVTSGLDLMLVAALVVWHFGRTRSGTVCGSERRCRHFPGDRSAAGRGVVLLNHVARNASSSRAWSLSAHLINTLILLACLT